MKTFRKSLIALTWGMFLATAVNASDYVQPTMENLPVFSADGTKIGVLKKKTPVLKLRETPQMVMIEYSDESICFVGWAAKSYLAQCEVPKAKAVESSDTMSKPAPGAKTGSETTTATEKTILNINDTRKNLRTILKVPVNYIQQTETDRLQKTNTKGKLSSTEQSKVFLRLNPGDKNADGYAEITVLIEFERDSIVTFFVNEKITALEDFRLQASPDFAQVIDLYVQALKKYNEDLRGNFLSLCNRAEKYDSMIK